MNQVGKKGPALFILITVALTFTALGIFLDGEVLPTSPDTEKPVKAAARQSKFSQRRINSTDAAESSEVSQQLSRAIEAANRNESDSVSRLDKRINASQTLIDETNQLLEEKGVSSKGVAVSTKRQQFNQQLDDLKSRLAKLKASE
ncbi:MAG: hypothetical protein PVI97_17585 [Candidatus Thiodiazotropha sp.]|jgi:hypothetical protein